MATRGRIGIELSDGSILSSYHHWDSYPEWLGKILTTHYNTRAKVAELIDGGDMSSAWTNAGFNNETIAQGPLYYSQRGEDCPPRLDQNPGDFLTKDTEEYSYLYTREEGWLCYDTREWSESYLENVQIPQGELVK